MKISNRAKSALATAGYPVSEQSAITQLIAFAAQNSGIEPRNYYSDFRDTNGRRAYAQECRDISADWRRVKQALSVAAIEGVTDQDVIAAAPGAFSGRLEWVCVLCGFGDERDGKQVKIIEQSNATVIVDAPDYRANISKDRISGHWEYCTGQYFPTEYRKAAATVLEAAIRSVRQARLPEKRKVTSIAELKALNMKNGGCWFEPSTMRFFRTRIESGIIAARYFISSEQREDDTPRKFTVRSFDEQGDIDTIGDFHAHDTKADALNALKAHLAQIQ